MNLFNVYIYQISYEKLFIMKILKINNQFLELSINFHSNLMISFDKKNWTN